MPQSPVLVLMPSGAPDGTAKAGSQPDCPGCRMPMRRVDLERQHHGRVDVDLCNACQALWFDALESLHLSPGGTLALFRAIHEARPEARRALPARVPCPRCDTPLTLTHDLQRTTRFSYYRCRHGHGRFTPFFQFLREKDFVRPVPPDELERLKKLVRIIRCSSCGAPVDLERATACGYCRAPIVVLDPDAVTKALRQLDTAEARRTRTAHSDPHAAGILEAARFAREMKREQARTGEGSMVDLVSVGLGVLAAALLARG